MSKKFAKNFYWGAATSAHQVEGGLKNNWSQWEYYNAEIESKFYKNGRKRFFNYPVGEKNIKEACTYENYISGKAADSFNKYKEDVQILKELNLNSYRFSVDWSRIEPEKGEFSREGLDYYSRLIKGLKDNGIEPFLTCWHWPIPLWLEKEGGLLAKNIVEYFERYVDVLVKHFGEDVKYWMTINEPLGVSFCSYLVGKWPPQEKNIFRFNKVAFNTLVEMHKKAYLVIKEYNEDLQVSVAENNAFIEPYNNWFFNRWIANAYRYINNYRYLDSVRDYLDYLGLNHYFHYRVGIFGLRDTYEKRSDIGWGLKPYSIYYVLKELKNRYDLPIIITENGLADRDDKNRKWWLDETFRAMEDALEECVDLFGYLHWSLLDNFEWAEGFWPKFGLVEVDRKTLDRKIRESGYYYRGLVKREQGKEV